MATDGPTPAPCDGDIFSNGTAIFLTHSIPSCAMEGWVQHVAKDSGQRVDWSFTGGRAIVRYLGDGAKVRAAIMSNINEHDRLYRKATGGDYRPPRCFFDENGELVDELV